MAAHDARRRVGPAETDADLVQSGHSQEKRGAAMAITSTDPAAAYLPALAAGNVDTILDG